MNLAVAAATFPIIFIGELPDKTMFASLVMASRGRPLWVWLGAALAFAVHVAIAVLIGVALFNLLPKRALDGVVAALFLAGAVYSFLTRNQEEEEEADVGDKNVGTPLRTVAAAGGVIFLAEWGDLTQVLTANLSAHYKDPLSVAVGAVLALWAVAAIAVIGGTSLLKVLSVRTLRLATAVVLVGLAAYTAVLAIRG